MITINDTALNDNQLIFVLRITLDSSTLRYATREITLSSNTYSDSVLLRVEFSTLAPVGKFINIYNGGGVGSLSAFEFSLSNYSGKYIEDFYPSTSQDYLTARKVEVGFLWVGATTEAEITWLNTFYVNSVSVETNKITCFCIELSDIEIMELPYYEVQKDFNNGVSYFPEAPEESFGVSIPIAYGGLRMGFTVANFDLDRLIYANLAPSVPIHKQRNGFITTSHKCFYTPEDIVGSQHISKFINGIEAYLNITSVSTSEVNNDFGFYQYLGSSTGVQLVGVICIRLFESSSYSDLDIGNAINDDSTDYVTVADGETIAFRTLGSASSSDIGLIKKTDIDDIRVYFRTKANPAAQGYRAQYYNTAVASPAGYYYDDTAGTTESFSTFSFATATTAKRNTEPWTLEELTTLEYTLKNDGSSPGNDIYIYYAFLRVTNIVVASIGREKRYDRASIRDTGGRSG